MSPTTMTWRKSSFCADSACVEVALDGDMIAVRDGKNPAGGHLRFTLAEWDAFVRGVVAGEFRPL